MLCHHAAEAVRSLLICQWAPARLSQSRCAWTQSWLQGSIKYYCGGCVQDGAPEALAPVREALGGADGHEPHRRMAGDGQHHNVEALHIIRASYALRTGSRPASILDASQPLWQHSGACQDKGSIELAKHRALPHCQPPQGLSCGEHIWPIAS